MSDPMMAGLFVFYGFFLGFAVGFTVTAAYARQELKKMAREADTIKQLTMEQDNLLRSQGMLLDNITHLKAQGSEAREVLGLLLTHPTNEDVRARARTLVKQETGAPGVRDTPNEVSSD